MLLAVGDSIANGHGNVRHGVPSQSWALWLARTLDKPITMRAIGGAASADVLRDQCGGAGGHWLATVSVGTNDVIRQVDADTFGENARRILAALAERCDAVVVTDLQPHIGRPARDAAPYRAALHEAAELAGAHVVSVAGMDRIGVLGGDHVHYTAQGQRELAWRAAVELRAAKVIGPGIVAQLEADPIRGGHLAWAVDRNHGVLAATARRVKSAVAR